MLGRSFDITGKHGTKFHVLMGPGAGARGVGIAIRRELCLGDVKEPWNVEGASVVSDRSDPDLQGRWAFNRVYLGGALCSPGHEG